MQANSRHHKLFHFRLSFWIWKFGKEGKKLQNFEYLENEKNVLDEIKNIFLIFFKGYHLMKKYKFDKKWRTQALKSPLFFSKTKIYQIFWNEWNPKKLKKIHFFPKKSPPHILGWLLINLENKRSPILQDDCWLKAILASFWGFIFEV